MKATRNTKVLRDSTTGHFVTQVSSSGGRHMSTSDALGKHLSESPTAETQNARENSRSIGGAKVTVNTKKAG